MPLFECAQLDDLARLAPSRSRWTFRLGHPGIIAMIRLRSECGS
jgi:hypothetical protein